jgi:hypothetical protein
MPFQPGNSGHPEGQRRVTLFAEALRMEIAAAGDDYKALRWVARALLAEAYKGNIAAIAMIADRFDGKVPQPVGGSDELGPQRLHISWGGRSQYDGVLAAPANNQDAIDGETKEPEPAVRSARLHQAGSTRGPAT